MTILQISRSGTDMLLRVITALFWLIRTGGFLALFVEAVRWVADLGPLNARLWASYAGMVLVGWSVSGLCAMARSYLKEGANSAELSARNAG